MLPMPSPVSAQRRPALLGRSTPRMAGLQDDGLRHRSTKAGPVGPATRRCRRRAGNTSPRSTKAGPVGPATLVARATPRERPAWTAALNEGRPCWAGNPWSSDLSHLRRGHRHRSTKAGPVGPATPSAASDRDAATVLRAPLNEGRPCWAGNPPGRPRSRLLDPTTVAQRRPALLGRQPCEELTSVPVVLVSATLNEGRPCWAGNPVLRHIAGEGHERRALNEGRPCWAGNPVIVRRRGRWAPRGLGAQRRPALLGRQPWPMNLQYSLRGLRRSTKAGPVGPATPLCR